MIQAAVCLQPAWPGQGAGLRDSQPGGGSHSVGAQQTPDQSFLIWKERIWNRKTEATGEQQCKQPLI